MKSIIGVKFHKEDSGEFEGREYNYYDGVGGLAVGDIAIAIVREKEKRVKVTAVGVPESAIDERMLPTLKTISKRFEPKEDAQYV